MVEKNKMFQLFANLYMCTRPLLFALGQKPFRHLSKIFSTKGENVFDQRQKVYDQAV